MNTEIANQNTDPATNQGAGEKTFTQDDVNRIVQERLAKDRERHQKNWVRGSGNFHSVSSV